MLAIHLLGTPKFNFGGPLENTLPRRSLSLLAYLLLHRDGEVPRDRLAFTLWPDVPEDDARAHLRRAFYTLGLWLPEQKSAPWFVADRRHARWNANAPYWLDVQQYETLARDGSIAEAVELYAGDLLEPLDEDWIVTERERLRSMQLALLRRVIDQQRTAGQIAEAIESVQKALKIDPWLEELVRELIELRARNGDRAAAIRDYRSFEQALKREMSAAPERDTVAVFERICGDEQDVPPPLSSRGFTNNIPAELTMLVGRALEVDELKKALESHRLVSIVGAGGIGKTRLALRVGAEVTERYRDGVWHVDLASISTHNFIPSAVAAAINIHESRDRTLFETVVRALNGRRALLIFDNCEHLVDEAARFAEELLRTSPKLQIVITSSQPLNIPGECVYRVDPLTFPSDFLALTAEQAIHYSAIELFVQRAHAADYAFELTDANAPAVAEICQRLDGIALAIELAAARVRALNPSGLNQGLKARFRLLTSESRTGLQRHHTLRALIDWSYGLLDQREKGLLRRVAIFAGSFSLQAVTAICADPGMDELDVLNTLASLVEKSLVVAELGEAAERYRLLESTREYLREELDKRNERDATAKAHAKYYQAFAESVDREFHSTPQAAWFSNVALEYENLRATLLWSLTEQHDVLLGATIAGDLRRFWYNCGRPQEGLYWIECALDVVDEASTPQIAANLHLARALLLQGIHKLEAAERACQLFETLNDSRGLGYALRQCALALPQENRTKAEELCTRAADLLKNAPDIGDFAMALNTLGSIVARRGDFERAAEIHEQALTAATRHGAEYALIHTHLCLADLEFQRDAFQQAVTRAEQALILVDAKHTAQLAANLRLNLAIYRVALGQYDGAANDLVEALALLRTAHDSSQTAIALQHVALIAAMAGKVSQAARLAGYVDSFVSANSMERQATEALGRERLAQSLRAQLSEETYRTLARAGALLSEEQAIEEALALLRAPAA